MTGILKKEEIKTQTNLQREDHWQKTLFANQGQSPQEKEMKIKIKTFPAS